MNTIIGDYCYAGIKENLSLFQNDENLFEKLDKFLEKYKDETKILFIMLKIRNANSN